MFQAQKEDPDIGPLLKWVEEDTRPQWGYISSHSETLKCYWAQWDSLTMRGGVLYRIWENPAGNNNVLQLHGTPKEAPTSSPALSSQLSCSQTLWNSQDSGSCPSKILLVQLPQRCAGVVPCM